MSSIPDPQTSSYTTLVAGEINNAAEGSYTGLQNDSVYQEILHISQVFPNSSHKVVLFVRKSFSNLLTNKAGFQNGNTTEIYIKQFWQTLYLFALRSYRRVPDVQKNVDSRLRSFSISQLPHITGLQYQFMIKQIVFQKSLCLTFSKTNLNLCF